MRSGDVDEYGSFCYYCRRQLPHPKEQRNTEDQICDVCRMELEANDHPYNPSDWRCLPKQVQVLLSHGVVEVHTDASTDEPVRDSLLLKILQVLWVLDSGEGVRMTQLSAQLTTEGRSEFTQPTLEEYLAELIFDERVYLPSPGCFKVSPVADSRALVPPLQLVRLTDKHWSSLPECVRQVFACGGLGVCVPRVGVGPVNQVGGDPTGLEQRTEWFLQALDTGDGVLTAQLLAALGPEVTEHELDDMIFELAYEGRVYQPRPDYYRIYGRSAIQVAGVELPLIRLTDEQWLTFPESVRDVYRRGKLALCLPGPQVMSQWETSWESPVATPPAGQVVEVGPQAPPQPQVETLATAIVQLLGSLDTGAGVGLTQLLTNLGPDVEEVVVDDILFELAYEGRVYQPRPDCYKLMD